MWHTMEFNLTSVLLEHVGRIAGLNMRDLSCATTIISAKKDGPSAAAKELAPCIATAEHDERLGECLALCQNKLRVALVVDERRSPTAVQTLVRLPPRALFVYPLPRGKHQTRLREMQHLLDVLNLSANATSANCRIALAYRLQWRQIVHQA